MGLPQFIADRVRQPVPPACGVVPGSTPVISFGDSATAHVATLGLNPSRQEFLSEDGSWLSGTRRRLATHESLGLADLTEATDEQVGQVVADCNEYFHRNPYWKWFRPLERLLTTAFGASYEDGSACHLDLVQWATDPVWGRIRDPETRARLLTADRDFLIAQLRGGPARVILLNGRGVMREIEARLELEFVWRADATAPGKKAGIATAEGFGTHFVGWTTNLQSSFGVTGELRSAIAERVGDEARRL